MATSDGGWSDPGLLVLDSLASGPKHGYAITEDVATTTGARLGPGRSTAPGACVAVVAAATVAAVVSVGRGAAELVAVGRQ